MDKKNITNDDIANSIIEMNKNIGTCNVDTANGFRTSNKKEILKSEKEGSFSRFNREIEKSQKRKE